MSEFAFATPLAFRIDLLPPASLPQPATPNVPITHPGPLYTPPGGDDNSVPINQELLLVPGIRPRHRSLTRTLGGRNHFSLQVKKQIRARGSGWWGEDLACESSRSGAGSRSCLNHLVCELPSQEQVLSNQPALCMAFYTPWTLNKYIYWSFWRHEPLSS